MSAREPNEHPVDEKIHVFTLRFWREPREVEHASPKWRGIIIHLASGQKQYFENLDDLLKFIMPFIAEMGLTVVQKEEPTSWFQRWLDSLRKRSK